MGATKSSLGDNLLGRRLAASAWPLRDRIRSNASRSLTFKAVDVVPDLAHLAVDALAALRASDPEAELEVLAAHPTSAYCCDAVLADDALRGDAWRTPLVDPHAGTVTLKELG